MWVPKSGTHVNFWTDLWLMENPLCNIVDQIPDNQIQRKVNEYVNINGEWDWNSLENLLTADILLHLAAININTNSNECDEISWKHSSSGCFSTKSAFNMISLEPTVPSDLMINSKWKLKVPMRIQFFIWLASQSRILTNEERKRRHIIDYDTCGLCNVAAETTLHILRDCQYSQDIWSKMGIQQFMSDFFYLTHDEWWKRNLKNNHCHIWDWQWNLTFCSSCWLIWKWRNYSIFQQGEHITVDKCTSIKIFVEECKMS